MDVIRGSSIVCNILNMVCLAFMSNVHHLFAVGLDISIQLGSIDFHLESRFMFPFKMFFF